MSEHELKTAAGRDMKDATSTIDDNDVYELVHHSPRGFAVIVNIAKGRPGSENDVRMMTDLFSQLQYEVMVFENVTKEVLANYVDYGLWTTSAR